MTQSLKSLTCLPSRQWLFHIIGCRQGKSSVIITTNNASAQSQDTVLLVDSVDHLLQIACNSNRWSLIGCDSIMYSTTSGSDKRLVLAAVLATGLHAGGAVAAEPESFRRSAATTASQTGDDPEMDVVEVSVERRRALQSEEVLTSVSVIRQGDIKNMSVNDPLDLLRRAPGAYTEQFHQGIITSEVGIRGFNTQGEIPSLKLLIDGIPSNLHIGTVDMKPIFPLNIQRMELVRGTNDPRHGLYAVAGSLHVDTRRGGNETVFRGMAGGFGVREAQAASAFENSWFSQNVFGGFRFSDGYRDNSELSRYSLSGKWFAKPKKGVEVGFIGRLFRMEAQAPGYLSEAEASESPREVPGFSLTDGGIQRNEHGSLHLNWDLTRDLYWSLKAYHQRLARRRWVRFTEAGSQQLRFQREKQTGALTQITYRPGGVWGLEDVTVSAGADFQYQDNLFRRFATDNRVLLEPTRGQQLDVLSTSAFAQVDIRPVKAFAVVAGMRWDHLDGSFEDLLSDGGSRDMTDFGSIWQPKVSAVLTPYSGYDLYANYGRTFQVPGGDGLYSTQQLTWSKNDGVEAGVKLSPSPLFRASLAYFRQTASDEVHFVFNSTTDSENVGKTLRSGIDLEARVLPLPQLQLWGSYSWLTTERQNPGANLTPLEGTELNHVPRYLLKAGADFRPFDQPLVASVWTQSQGTYHITNSFNYEAVSSGQRFGAFTLVNLDVTYTWQSLAFGAHVKNLLDSSWTATIWNDGAVNLVNPGDRRAIFGSVQTRWGSP